MSNQMAVAPIKTVQELLEKQKPQLARVLPKHVTPDRLVRIAMTCIRNNPSLLECEQTSLLASIMTCAQLGLEPDPVLGQAYLVPFNTKVNGRYVKKCQTIVGYRGLLTLARNSGEVMSVLAKEVYEKDKFKVNFSGESPLEYEPYLDEDRGKITHFFCLVRFKDGTYHFDWMTAAEVNKVRDSSKDYQNAVKKGRKDAPWQAHYAEMGKKTIIRRVAKYLPLSVQKASALEDMADGGNYAHLDENGDMQVEFAQPAAIEAESEPPVEGSKLDAFEDDGEPDETKSQPTPPEDAA